MSGVETTTVTHPDGTVTVTTRAAAQHTQLSNARGFGDSSTTVPIASPAPIASPVDELERLSQLRKTGYLSQPEFRKAKAAVLRGM